VIFYPRGFFRDPNEFSNPDVFDPDRFLDNNGKFVKVEKQLFFGLGRRRCPGEKVEQYGPQKRMFLMIPCQVAKFELLLYLAMVVQKFRVAFAQRNVDLQPEVSFVLEPKPFSMKVFPRQ
jgi:hypothetical protein